MPRPFFLKNFHIEEIIRVNHAGEYGAKVIYQGQLDFCKDKYIKNIIQNMQEQEEVHLKYFEEELMKRNINPSILLPIWHVLGYLAGAISVKISTEHTMFLTDAIETEIEKHYNKQIKILESSNEDILRDKIIQFCQEEVEHKNIAHDLDAQNIYRYKFFHKIITTFCKIAIHLSKKI